MTWADHIFIYRSTKPKHFACLLPCHPFGTLFSKRWHGLFTSTHLLNPKLHYACLLPNHPIKQTYGLSETLWNKGVHGESHVLYVSKVCMEYGWSCTESQKFSVNLMIIAFYINNTIMLSFHNRSSIHVEDTSNNFKKNKKIHANNISSITYGLHPWENRLSTQESEWCTAKAVRHPLSSQWLSSP